MVKPFSIQSPEAVAKEYGGNKQRIAEAAQLGVVDPTAAVLAGMFIDHMRSAQVMEQGNQPTIAAQVLGLGRAPAPQQAPQMAAPQPPMQPMAAPQPGMAEGGLINIDIPDNMYDEPNDGGFVDGMASGGLVAFSEGGMYDAPADDAAYKAWAARIIQQESSGRYGVTNPESGAAGIGQVIPATGRVLAKRAGFSWRPDLMKGKSKEAQQYQDTITRMALREAWNTSRGDPRAASAYYFAGPNKAKHGEKTAAYVAATNPGAQMAVAPRGVGKGIPGVGEAIKPEMKAPSLLELAGMFGGSVPKPDTTKRQALTAEIEQGMTPEARAAERKQGMWEALAKAGFTMASTPGSLLQALSAGAGAAMPDLVAARKEARAAQRADAKALADIEAGSNQEAQSLNQLIFTRAVAQAGLLTDEQKMQLQYALAQMDDATKRAIASSGNVLQDALAHAEMQNRLDVQKLQNEGYAATAAAKADAAGLGPTGNSADPLGLR